MMMTDLLGVDPIRLFSDYMRVTGVPTLAPAAGPDPKLSGKKLGVVNGSSWVSLWSTYFGRLMLPGVKIINAGNEAVQLNFMDAHHQGRIAEHHQVIADTIRAVQSEEHIDIVVLAQLSMSVFAFSHPDPVADFGVPVLNSGQTGFRRAGEVLAGRM